MRKLALLCAALLVAAFVGCNQPGKQTPVNPQPLPSDLAAASEPAPVPTRVGPEPTYPKPIPPKPTPTPVVTPKPTPTPTSAAGGKTYTVQKGDTLFSIARKLYSDEKRVKDIKALNPDVKNFDVLSAGQVLKVP